MSDSERLVHEDDAHSEEESDVGPQQSPAKRHKRHYKKIYFFATNLVAKN